jgi:hypothetical protein
VLEQLSTLLGELGDFRGMVQLYEDQILRGKDVATRAELARKVARMWEEQLADPREAADAWRRVLRMKQGDPEATAGLERAKSNMLKKPDPDAGLDQYAPPKPPSMAPPPPQANGPQSTTVLTPAVPIAAIRDDLPNTGQFVAALIDTNETPADAVRDTNAPSTPLPRETEQMDRFDPLMNPAMIPPPDASSVDLSDSDLMIEDSATDMGNKEDALSSTQQGHPPHPPLGGVERTHSLDFNDNEHTEYRPFVPPPDDDIVNVDDMAEEVTDDDDKKNSVTPYPRS